MRKNTTVLPRHVIWPFLLFIVVSFGVLVTWTIVDPATFDRIEVESDEGIVSYPLCTYEVGFHIALQVPLFISMLIVLVMSYKTRHLPENITDSRRISRVLVSHVLVTFCKSVYRRNFCERNDFCGRKEMFSSPRPPAPSSLSLLLSD